MVAPRPPAVVVNPGFHAAVVVTPLHAALVDTPSLRLRAVVVNPLPSGSSDSYPPAVQQQPWWLPPGRPASVIIPPPFFSDGYPLAARRQLWWFIPGRQQWLFPLGRVAVVVTRWPPGSRSGG